MKDLGVPFPAKDVHENQKVMKSSFAGFLWALGWAAFGSAAVYLAISPNIASDNPTLALFTVLLGSGLLSLLPAFQSFPSGATWTALFAAGFWSRWIDTCTTIGGPSDITSTRIELAAGVAWVALGIVAIRDLQRNKNVPFMPALFCLAGAWLIAQFSAEAGGASGMADWLIRIAGISAETAASVTTIARKSIHFLFYGLLALAAFRLAYRGGAKGAWAVAWAFAFALALSLFDETRQSFVVGRTGSIWDVLLDVAGMAVFVGIAYAFSRRGSKQPAT